MKNKFNKLSKGKKIAIAIGGIVVFVALFGGTDTETVEIEQTTQTTQIESVEPQATPVVEETVEDNVIKAGTYKVGSEIEAGTYLVTSDGGLFGSYMELTKDSSGQFDSIISNENFDTHTFIEVKDGEYLKIDDSSMVLVDDTTKISHNGKLEDGMYRVGIDIPAGEYKVIPVEGSTFGAYLEVTTNARHNFDGIVANESFENPTYITVKDGQYLTLSSCYIEVE